MVFLYFVLGVVALGLFSYALSAFRSRAIPPSIDRYHRALGRLGEMSEHVKVLEDQVDAEQSAGRTVHDVPTAARHDAFPRASASMRLQEVVPPAQIPPTPPAPPEHTAPPTEANGNGADEPDEELAQASPTRAPVRRVWIIALSALVLIGGGVGGTLLLANSPPRRDVARGLHRSKLAALKALPNLVGLSVSDAETQLATAGLSWQVVNVTSPNLASAGHVLSQSPRFPGTIRTNQFVTLDVGGPIATASVPEVAEPPERLQLAEAAVRKAGFVAKTTLVKAATTHELALQGMVIKQLPKAGTKAALHSAVTLEVISGVGTTVIPPNIDGESLAEAGATLVGAQLRIGTTTSRYSRTVPAGDVVSTSPSLPGQTLTVGSTVNLVVSSGRPAIVPALVGDTLATARRALRAAGLVLGNVDQTPGAAGIVLAQAARAGRQLPPGTPITLVVGSSPSSTVPTTSSSSV